MGVNVTRVVKFIRKGDKGSDAVRYWLIPSVSSVTLSNIEDGTGTPAPSSVTVRLMKQVGDDTPTTITAPASVGLTISYSVRKTGVLLTLPKSYNGAVTVPTDTEYTAIEFNLYNSAQLIDTVTIPIIHDGEDGKPGQPGIDGKDGVSYSVILTPNSMGVTADGLPICESNSISAKAYKNVGGDTHEANDGAMVLVYTKKDGAKSEVSATGITAEGAANYAAVSFEYRVNSVTVASAALVINREGQPGADGKDGDRGPTLRGPQAWSDCIVGYKFQSGAKGEAYKDVVLYQNNYYSCVKSHAKKSSNFPGSPSDLTNKYWQLGDKVELIATKILLATYALVKNLGVEAIDMKDTNGNILFQAKDGNVTCKTGTFENIVFSGLMRKKRTTVDASNFASIFKLYENEDNTYDIDFSVSGTWLDIQYLPQNIIIYPRAMRALCGNTILLYNNSEHAINISAPSTKNFDGSPGAFNSFTISPGKFASLECRIGSKSDSETAYFLYQTGNINNNLDN